MYIHIYVHTHTYIHTYNLYIILHIIFQQSAGTNLELILQLWLTLNLDASSEQSNCLNQFDPSLSPVIPLSSTAISNLISALCW